MFVIRENGKIVAAFASLQPGLAEEELANGHAELEAFLDPPQPDPLTLPLPRLVFWLVAAQASVSKWSVRDRIAAMPEGLEKYEAIAWFEEAVQYRRNDPILIEQATAEGIPPEQLDSLWIWALQSNGLLPPPS